MLSHRRILTLSTVALVSLAACGGSDSDAGDAQPGPATTAATADTAADAPTDSASDTSGTSDTPDTADDAQPAPSGGAPAVNIENSRFDPVDLQVAVGDTVTFTNADQFAHTVTSEEDSTAAFDSDEFADGATFELTVDEPGTYNYFCEIHPTMQATIVAS